ncbi:MAG: hypothetical protein MUC29_05370, partial [Pyrinomonadaceae bacterium]|nr:hypothetical protein [Pyrinomonadaceae bacterium]
RFEVAQVINLMLKGYGLEEACKKRSIVINMACDGSRITSRLHHTTFGVKMADIAARDPSTGNLIYGSKDHSILQSKHYCHPIMMILARETTHVMDNLKGPLQEVKNLTKSEFSKKLLKGAKPLKAKLNADLSAIWKIGGRGYGMKKGRGRPCHICSVEDDQAHNYNAIKCNHWCKILHSDNPQWKCFHQDFLNEDTVKQLRSDLEEVRAELNIALESFDEIKKNLY